MAANKPIRNALISVFSKEGLDLIVKKLHELGISIYSTGGTQRFIQDLGIPEWWLDFPSNPNGGNDASMA